MKQMLALGFENVVFLLLLAVALLFQLLTRAAAKMGKDADETTPSPPSPPPTPPPIPRAKPLSDQDRIREFLEALGQPTTSKPPAPVIHRTDIPPRPVAPIEPPRSMRPFSFPQRRLTPEERRKSIVILEKTVSPPAPAFEFHREPRPLEAAPAVTIAAEAYAIPTQPTVAPEQTETGIATLIRSTSGLRNAIILREIFGPPRSLQPLDPIGTV